MFNFLIVLINSKDEREQKSYSLETNKPYLEAWQDAVNFATERLKELPKTWRIDTIRHLYG